MSILLDQPLIAQSWEDIIVRSLAGTYALITIQITLLSSDLIDPEIVPRDS